MTTAPHRAPRLAVIVACMQLVGATTAAHTQPMPRNIILALPSANNVRDLPSMRALIDEHRELNNAIVDFQNKWRKAWQKIEMKRHKPIDLETIRGWGVQRNGVISDPIWHGDRDAQNMTPDLRRYLAMLCYIDSPSDRAIEAAKAKSKNNIGTPVTRAQIQQAVSDAGKDGVDRLREASGGRIAISSVIQRRILPSPNFGAICPSWNPPDLPLPLDEGEAIDLAFPPADRAGVRKDREALIRKLEVAHAQFPQDNWIAGQRVRFVYDQREPARTIEAARACDGDKQWCTSLMALALEQAQNIPAAEAAYAAVAALAPPVDSTGACFDRALLLLLRPGDRDVFTKSSCDRQRVLAQQLWWLADPLWSVNGNERYVANESRKLTTTLRAINDRDERYIWARPGGGEAMHELVLRYGWPGYTYWPGFRFEEEINLYLENVTTRTVYNPHTAMEYSTDRTALIPAMSAIADPFSLNATHWDLNMPGGRSGENWWPQEHMMLFTKLSSLPVGQDVRFRRDTSVLYQLAVDDPLRNLDTAATGASLASLMGGSSSLDTRTLASSAVGVGLTLRMGASISSSPIVLSAEILPRTKKERAMRLRFGMHPPPTLREMSMSDVALSDPLFMRMPNRDMSVPTDQGSVLRYMAGALTFARIEPLGVYWESYGFVPGDSVQVNLKVRRNDDVNAARRLGAALGVASPLRDSIAVQWTEPDARHASVVLGGSKPIVGRAIALDLNGLSAGRYVVTIEMRRGTNIVARSERQFNVTEL